MGYHSISKHEEARRLLEKMGHETSGDNREIMMCQLFLLYITAEVPAHTREVIVKKVWDYGEQQQAWITRFYAEPDT